MSISYGFKEVLILAPIVGLLLVGVAIALQSGLRGGGDPARQAMPGLEFLATPAAPCGLWCRLAGDATVHRDPDGLALVRRAAFR